MRSVASVRFRGFQGAIRARLEWRGGVSAKRHGAWDPGALLPGRRLRAVTLTAASGATRPADPRVGLPRLPERGASPQASSLAML